MKNLITSRTIFNNKFTHTYTVRFIPDKQNIRKLSLSFLFILLVMFTSFSQSITLLSPNGGESWMTGTTQTIQWQLDGEYADLFFEYSTDNGQYWYYLGYVAAEDSTSEISFVNNLYETETALLKVSLYDDESVFDQSDSSFRVVDNPVYFYTPSAGQQIYVNSDITLTWYTYEIDTFDIDYSMDNGNSWTQIAASHSETNIEWTTPNSLSDQCIIRITDSDDPTVYGLSATFSLVEKPTASLISPNGGETWNYGSTATVSWTGTNLPYYLYIDYSNDGGQSWEYLGYGYGDETSGSAEIYVPYDPTTEAMVRLSDPYFGNILDASDQTFTIYVPPVIMYNPYEGQEFYIKDETWISWLTTGIANVNIELSTDGGGTWSTIEENVDAEYGYYNWQITGIPSTNCFIRVSDANDNTKSGLSGQFTLLETPVIELTSPTGGEIWNTDSTYTIAWNYDNPDAYYVYIDYSADSGQTWNYLGYNFNENGQGSFDWRTPITASDAYLVRVRDSYLDFVSDTSGLFSIKAFPETPICIVSVDTATNQNIIVWEKPVDELIDAFIIFKETDEMDVYEAIGTVPYDNLPEFTDANSNPAIKSYRYKLGFADVDGNVYPAGKLHQTIHLAINKGVGDSWNLIWTDYLGIDVATYNIYRSSNGSAYEMIETVSSSFNSFTDIQAPQGDVYYFVEIINENGCNVSKRDFSNSISNVATNNFLSIDKPGELSNTYIYPNPAMGSVKVSLDDPKDLSQIQIVDLTGSVIYDKKFTDKQNRDDLTIDVSGLMNGLYFLNVISAHDRKAIKLIVSN